MRKRVLLWVTLISIFAVSTVAAKGINIKDSKVLKVLWNKKELNVSNNASAIILENRVYVPTASQLLLIDLMVFRKQLAVQKVIVMP